LAWNKSNGTQPEVEDVIHLKAKYKLAKVVTALVLNTKIDECFMCTA